MLVLGMNVWLFAENEFNRNIDESNDFKYFVIDNTSPGTPVFDSAGNWLGVVVYKMEAGKPSAIVTLPVEDILEIADQVRSRNQ